MSEVLRLDFQRFTKVERTPSGGMRVPANLTRTGVFSYRKQDGTLTRELRHPDEVFNQDSLNTLRGAPVTDLHPKDMVSPSNWREVSVGHVGDVKADGSYVYGRLDILDSDAIKRVERGDRKELSCGYRCTLEETPGTYKGERYDTIQRGIVYNHVAIGPKDWGRAGNKVALRLDSGDAIQVEPKPEGPPPPKKEVTTMLIRVDGIEYEAGSSAHLQAVDKWDTGQAKKVADLTSERDTAKAEADVATARADKAEADLKVASDPKKVEELVTGRVQLHTDAKKVLGTDFDPSGKTTREIQVSAIKADVKDFDPEGKSDDYVAAYFAATVKNHSRSDEGGTGIGAARDAATGGKRKDKTDDTDEDDHTDSDKSRARMNDHNRDAWKRPLAFNKRSN